MTMPTGDTAGRVGPPPPKIPMPPADKIPEGVDPSKLPGGSPPQVKKYVKIPANYADVDKSGLTHPVTKGAQDWDIKSK